MHNTISLYDQTFNRGYELGERKWDGKRMAWLPEKTDHPLQGKDNCNSSRMYTYTCTVLDLEINIFRETNLAKNGRPRLNMRDQKPRNGRFQEA